MSLCISKYMDWKLLFSTFILVFTAELGDKTQLAVLLSASSSGKFWETFLGGALALVLSTLIAALVGESISKFISPHLIKISAGLLFIVIGVLILVR